MRSLIGLGLLIWHAVAHAQVPDLIFGGPGGGFEVLAPVSDAEAARFLTRATFGPTPANIAALRSLGYAAWIDQQLTRAPSLQRPRLEAQIADLVINDEPRFGPSYRRYRIDQWFRDQLTAGDELRQKVAYALSQILVVSDIATLDSEPISIAEYNDVLIRNAFGRYRTLIGEVTRTPVMGIYLSTMRNSKTDWSVVNNVLTPSVVAPDENYAREIMQLFSIGLIERNLDFSPILMGNQPIPTYTPDTITNTARVFTGLAFRCTGNATVGTITLNRNCNCTGADCNFSTTLFSQTPPKYRVDVNGGVITALTHPDRYAPMVCYPRYADTGRSATSANNYAVLPAPFNRKQIIGGIMIEPSTVACHNATPTAERQACINYCDNQIDTVLNALSGHPNVAPFIARQLIQRLVTSNPTPGYIRRVAQVFENDGSGVRGNLGAVVKALLLDQEAMSPTPAPEFGKLREPMLRLIAVWRAFGAVPNSEGLLDIDEPEDDYLQRPLGAPSVFNFYEPDYAYPGEIQTAGLVSPELQITSESSVVSVSDDLYFRIFAGYSFSGSSTTNFSPPNDRGYIPVAQLDALPAANAALVEALNQRLMYGAMSSTMKSKLIAFLDGPLAATDKRRKALNLIHLIAISPEFAVQR